MTVELINYNQGGVLDLTGGEDADKQTEELDLTGAGAEGQEVATDAEVPATGQDDGAADGAADSDVPDSDAAATDDADAAEGEFFFGDEAVSVTVPDEIKEALAEAGVDEKVLLGELFAKGGKFELTDDTRGRLEAKFGKVAVNGYLNMYRKMNEMSAKERAESTKAAAAQEAEYAKEYSEMVGGEAGLKDIEAFVLDNFDEKQLASYNAIMDTDNHAAHMLVLSQVKQSMELQRKLKHGDKNIELIGDKSAASDKVDPLSKGYLTSEEYAAAMDSEQYWTDREYMSKVDAARNAGLRKGI